MSVRPFAAIRLLALLLALGAGVFVVPAPARAQIDSLGDAGRGFHIDARQMLGQEDVGGLRHILLDMTLRQGAVTISAPRGYYYTGLDLTAMGGGVRLIDSTLTVRADTAAYFRLPRLLEAIGNVILTEPGLRVEGARGTYDRGANVFRLTGNVFGEERGRVFRGDDLDWDRRTGRFVLTGRARLEDPARNAIVRGARIDSDTTGAALVTGSPVLDWTRDGDAVVVTGERLRIPAGGGRFHAAGNVTVRQGAQTVTADSAVFLDREGLAWFYGAPRVVDADGRVTGDTLVVDFADGGIGGAVMRGNAELDYTPSAPDLVGERSVIRGDSLNVNFDEGRIRSLTALGSPSVNYQPGRADSARGTGRVEASADTVVVELKDGSVDRVRLTGGAHGRYVYRSRAAADSLEIVEYAADRILFRLADRLMQLRGSGQTDYRTLTLKAEEIDFDAAKEVLTAAPKPILIDRAQQGGQEVVGERIAYDLKSTRGTIYHGRTQYEDGYIFADSLRKVTDVELNAGSGQYTTCDLIGKDEDPHFHFTSRRMKIYLGDKVVAKPVTLYIGNIPVFALPFYVFSIRKGRHSGLILPRFEFGLTGSGDRFFENLGYYWAANDYSDFTFRTAYRENPGVFIGEMTARYAKRGVLDGQVELGRAFGLDRGLNQAIVRHRQTLGEGASLTADLEFADPEYRLLRGLGAGIGNRVDRQLRSTAGLSKSWRNAGINMNLNVNIREALDADLNDGVDQETKSRVLPSLNFSVNSRRLGRLATEDRPAFLPWASTISYGLNFRGQNSSSERERTITRAMTDSTAADTTRFLESSDSKNGTWSFNLQDNRKALGFLNVTPRFNLNEFWVDREFSAEDTVMGFRRAATWSLGVSSGFSAFGTVAPKLFGIEAIRHTFSPAVGFNWNPDFRSLTYADPRDTTGTRRLARFPGVAGGRSRSLNYSIENRFQAKVRSGEELKRVDLFSWSLNGSYDLLAASEGRPMPASDISSAVDLNRIQGVNLNFRSSHDVYNQLRFNSYSAQASFGLTGRLPGSSGDKAAASSSDGDAPTAPLGGAVVESARPATPGYDRAPSVYDTPQSAGASVGEALDWRASFGFSISGSRTTFSGIESTARLNGKFDLKLSRNWGLLYNNDYSFETNEITYQQLSLRRDLHCWEAAFTYSATPRSSEFYFRISVKSLPDLKFESGQGLGAFDTLSGISPTGGF
jgi:lipopolysaccharide export system protein LptA